MYVQSYTGRKKNPSRDNYEKKEKRSPADKLRWGRDSGAREGGDGGRRGHRSKANNNRVEALPVSAMLLRLRTFRMSLVIFLMVCRASSLSLPTPYRTTNLWLHSWLALSSWRPRRDKKIQRKQPYLRTDVTVQQHLVKKEKVQLSSIISGVPRLLN